MNIDFTIKLLIEHEDYVQLLYDDANDKRIYAPIGNATVGIGFNMQGEGLSLAESKAVLAIKLERLTNQLSHDLDYFNALDEVRQAVLIDMAYNMGLEGLLEFKDTLQAVKTKDWDSAVWNMHQSKWAKEIQLSRVHDLSNMMLTGKWPDYIMSA